MNKSFENIFEAQIAAPGIGLGYVYHIRNQQVPFFEKKINQPQCQEEIHFFNKAVEESKHQLDEVKKRIVNEFGEDHAYLVEAQIMMLDDPNIVEEVRELVREELVNAQCAIRRVFGHFYNIFEQAEDPFFKERFGEIRFVEERLLKNLNGGHASERYVVCDENAVVLARDLSPLDLMRFPRSLLAGIVLESGGKYSHLAILTRSLNIPCLYGVDFNSRKLSQGQRVIVDGFQGSLIVDPSDLRWERYKAKKKNLISYKKELLKNRFELAETRDGLRVQLLANIDFVEDLGSVKENGAEGVGLLRTEALFLGSTFPPSEEEQFEAYQKIVSKVSPDEVVIRLFDVDQSRLIHNASVGNLALGLRGVRLLMRFDDILRTQIRSILRASVCGKVSILIPMVSQIGEIRHVSKLIKEEAQAMGYKQVWANHSVRLGAMIELPSAVMISNLIAKEVDFMSIGTNDLIQYTLGVDRSNALVSDLYTPFHPAVIDFISTVVKSARKNGVQVGICGEMAHNQLLLPIMIALEVDFLSMNPTFVPLIKQLICKATLKKAKQCLSQIRSRFDDSHEAEQFLKTWCGPNSLDRPI